MKDLTLAESYAIISLNSLDSLQMITIKRIALRCVAAAAILELYLNEGFTKLGDKYLLQKSILDQPITTLYQVEVLKKIFKKQDCLEGTLEWWLKKASKLSGRELKKIEHAITDSLRGVDLIEEVPNLLGCDLEYVTATISMREYRSNKSEFTKQTEGIRSELLEDGCITDESVVMLWLLRESCCLPEIFSANELETVLERFNELYQNNTLAKKLLPITIQNKMEVLVKGFLLKKKRFSKTLTGIGLNFTFPIIERTESVFIETEAYFSSADQRLEDVVKRLRKYQHEVTILRAGVVPLLKIDNVLYEAAPTARVYKFPVHGVQLRRYQMY